MKVELLDMIIIAVYLGIKALPNVGVTDFASFKAATAPG